MGKNLKGKECGKGICQRKDGLYYARFVDKTGKRHEKYLPTLPEARNWIEESKYADAHEDVFVATDTTVDQWFDFWIENIVGDLASNTLRNYWERYVHNIQPVMGKMMIANVKPMHCKKVFIQMDADYAGSTIRQAYITMGTMFKAAKMNDLIAKHPMDGVRFTKPVRATDDIKFLTRDEQRVFLETAKRSHNYNQYALILETGLRMGILDGIVEWIAEQVMYGLDLINSSVLGALGCDMSVFLRYFPAAETMYEVFVALAIGLILLLWISGVWDRSA